MTIRRNHEWTDEDFDILKRMLAADDDVRVIARVRKRSQIDVAAKAFVARQERRQRPTR